MDNKQLFTRFEYLPTSAVLKNNTKCVDVVLVYKQHVVTKSLYIPNKSGMKSSDFVDEAKKLINKQLNSGELEAYAEAQIKKEKKKKKGLIVCFSCLGVLALAGGAGVATYYFLRHKGPEVKVSIPKIDGLKFTNTRAYAGEDFDTKITIDTSKTDGKVLPDKLTRVSSGNREVKPTEYTYSITDEVKENAKLHIPGQYVEADITISLELVLPTPPSPIDDPTLSMSYRYTEGENKVKFNITTADSQEITVYWGEGEVETKTVTGSEEDGVYFEHTYTENRDYQIDVEGAVGSIKLSKFYEEYFAPGNQHVVSVSLYKEFTQASSWEFSMFGGTYIEVTRPDPDIITYSDIESVFIGENVKTIPIYAFFLCNDIKYVTLSSGLENIMLGAFQRSKVENVVIPHTVKTIGMGAFCCEEEKEPRHALQSISIENTQEHPSQLETIDSSAFNGSEITSFDVPKTVQSIGADSFANCKKLSSFTFEEGSVLKTLGDHGDEEGSTFANSTSITEIHLPDSLGANDAMVEKRTFAGWTNAQTIYVPFVQGSTPTGWSADWDNDCGAKITYQGGPEPVISEFTEIRYHYSGEETVEGDHNIGFAFTTTDNDVTVDWGNGTPVPVTSPAISPTLGDDATIKVYGDTDTFAFYDSEEGYYQWGNMYITSIIFAKHITTIDDMACPFMANLETVSLSEGITSVGMGAFYQCMSLKNLWLPNTLTSIGENAFNTLSSLDTITVEEGNPKYSSEGSNLIEISSKRLLCGSNASSIPGDIKTIDENAFYGLTKLQNIVIPSTLTSLGKQAFREAHIKSLSFANGVSELAVDAFREATIDEELVFPDSLTEFGKGAFKGAKLKFNNNTLTFPNSLSIATEECFKSASGFNTVVLNSNIDEIEEKAFENCSDLLTVDGTALTAAKVPLLESNCIPKNAGLQIKLASAEIRDVFLAATNKGWTAYESYIVVP